MRGVEASEDDGNRNYGETWVYESIVGAIPGIGISDVRAVAVQFVIFEVGVIALGSLYGIRRAVLAGTAAVVVAAMGSAIMLNLGKRIRRLNPPKSYTSLLFGSSIEIVLGLLAYVALVTYLFVFDARQGGVPLVENLLGSQPPVLVTYLMLLILWDVCYRIGTGWWASVVGFWRSYTCREELDNKTTRGLLHADILTIGFASTQLILVPFVWGHPLLGYAVVGHVIAVMVVSGCSIWLLSR
ncbi:MAG: hypothetical protein SV377_05015 [Halobacteria archaeon]|nr:hypothetical protein [Halobacteria archaeon]